MTQLATEGFPIDYTGPSIEIGFVQYTEPMADSSAIGEVGFVRADGVEAAFVTNELSKYKRGMTVIITSGGDGDAPRSVAHLDKDNKVVMAVD